MWVSSLAVKNPLSKGGFHTTQKESMGTIVTQLIPICIYKACKWQVEKLPEHFLAQKLRHIVSWVRYKQNISWNIHGQLIYI